MEGRGFVVRTAHSVAEGIDLIRQSPPAFAVVDMRLDDGTGLEVLSELSRVRPGARAIVLTGYGNFATAVTAVKLGAVDYLAKPADAEEILNALMAAPGIESTTAGKPAVGRPGPLGAYPARLRTVRPQCLGDRPPPQHAPPHPAAHLGEARAEVGRIKHPTCPTPDRAPSACAGTPTGRWRSAWLCGGRQVGVRAGLP